MGSHIQVFRDPPSPETETGITCPQYPWWPPPRPYTLGHMSTPSRVSLFPRHCTLHLTCTVPRVTPHPRVCIRGKQVYTVSRDIPPHRPCIWDCMSKDTRVTPPYKPCTWAHMPTVSRVIPSRPWTWGHISSVLSDTPPQTLYLGSHVHSL